VPTTPPLQLNVVVVAIVVVAVVVVAVVVVLTAFDRDHHCGCRLVNTPSFQLTLAKFMRCCIYKVFSAYLRAFWRPVSKARTR